MEEWAFIYQTKKSELYKKLMDLDEKVKIAVLHAMSHKTWYLYFYHNSSNHERKQYHYISMIERWAFVYQTKNDELYKKLNNVL
jgi:hypothetical protein